MQGPLNAVLESKDRAQDTTHDSVEYREYVASSWGII